MHCRSGLKGNNTSQSKQTILMLWSTLGVIRQQLAPLNDLPTTVPKYSYNSIKFKYVGISLCSFHYIS